MESLEEDLTAAERELICAGMAELGWSDFEAPDACPGFVQAHVGPAQIGGISLAVDIGPADEGSVGAGMVFLSSSYVYPLGATVTIPSTERLIRRQDLPDALEEFFSAVAETHAGLTA